jgi:hypothetical protein
MDIYAAVVRGVTVNCAHRFASVRGKDGIYVNAKERKRERERERL